MKRKGEFMERKHIPEAENRLTILYALRALGPATAMQLLQFLVENDLMNYFTMQFGLNDMREIGQLTVRPHPLGDLLVLTQEGTYAVETFGQRIPLSRRELIDQQAPGWRERFRLEQLAPADSFTLQDGRVCLRLRLLEGSEALLDILLILPQGTQPTFLEKRWRNAAQTVYRAVSMHLSEGFVPGEVPPPWPDTAAIEQTGWQEWMLSLVDDAAQPTLTLLLPMADEALARHCAAAWPIQYPSLRQLLLKELRYGSQQEEDC